MNSSKLSIHIDKTLSKENISIIKSRISTVERIFKILIKQMCISNSNEDILINFIREMGNDYVNPTCNTKLNIDLKNLKSEYKHFSYNLVKYQQFNNNNIYNLYLIYCLIIILRSLYNYNNQNLLKDNQIVKKLNMKLIELNDEIKKSIFKIDYNKSIALSYVENTKSQNDTKSLEDPIDIDDKLQQKINSYFNSSQKLDFNMIKYIFTEIKCREV